MEQLKQTIICKQCKSVLQSPVILPCGDSVCQEHIQPKSKEYDCLSCGESHPIPDKRFCINKVLNNLINKNIVKARFSPEYDEAQKSFKYLDQLVKEITQIQQDPYFHINKVISELKSEVDLMREEHKLKVDGKANAIIEKLNKYEEECKNELSSEKSDAKLKKFDLNIKRIKSYLEKWQNSLFNFESNEDELNEISQTGDKYSRDIQLEFKQLKNDLLLSKLTENQLKVIDFKNIELSLNREMSFKIEEEPLPLIESSILVATSLKNSLISLCAFPPGAKWKLLYRASDNKFSADSFHDKCDYKPKTLTIVKATNGFIFGGYTEVLWDQSKSYKKDKNAFLFSLINKEQSPVRMNITGSQAHAIICSPGAGPIFDEGFRIGDFSNLGMFSNSNIRSSFKHPVYPVNSEEVRYFLAGSNNFKVTDYEVYQISF